jgi:peroxiredoxin
MKQGIQPGDPAPDLALPDESGQFTRLSDFWRDRRTLLVFLRHFGCAHCRAHAVQLSNAHDRFTAAGLRVVLIGLGTPDDAYAFRYAFDLPFPALSDPAKNAYRAYGLLRVNILRDARLDTLQKYRAEQQQYGAQAVAPGQDFLQLGGDFIVDTAGIVTFAHYALRISDNPTTDAILAHAHDPVALG